MFFTATRTIASFLMGVPTRNVRVIKVTSFSSLITNRRQLLKDTDYVKVDYGVTVGNTVNPEFLVNKFNDAIVDNTYTSLIILYGFLDAKAVTEIIKRTAVPSKAPIPKVVQVATVEETAKEDDNLPAIIGGIIGGLLFLILMLYYLRKRSLAKDKKIGIDELDHHAFAAFAPDHNAFAIFAYVFYTILNVIISFLILRHFIFPLNDTLLIKYRFDTLPSFIVCLLTNQITSLLSYLLTCIKPIKLVTSTSCCTNANILLSMTSLTIRRWLVSACTSAYTTKY